MQFNVTYTETEDQHSWYLSKKFLNLKSALDFFNTLKQENKPEIIRTFTVVETLNATTSYLAYENGFNDAQNKKPKLQLREGEQLDYYWAYCEGFKDGIE